MAYYPDLGHQTQICSGEHVRAVGWLSKEHEFEKGELSQGVRDQLVAFVALGRGPMAKLLGAVTMGPHTCEFCNKFHAAGNVGIPDGGVLWVAPEMIAHYVEKHCYVPPKAFVEALMKCPLPDTKEFLVLAAPFEKLNRDLISDLIAKKRGFSV